MVIIRAQANATAAWHNLKVQLGLEQPTAMERMRAALGFGGPAAPLSSTLPHMPHVPSPPTFGTPLDTAHAHMPTMPKHSG